MPLLDALRAVAEPTRLNMTALLDTCDLNVGELAKVLGQSQPRVSRHLKLLCDAGVLVRHQEGATALFSCAQSGIGAEVVNQLRPLLDWNQPDLARAAERLADLRAARAEAAAAHFDRIAAGWDRFRGITVGEAVVEERLLALVADLNIHDLLDIGTGTGRMLELFAPYVALGLGIDLSVDMLNIARAKMDQPELRHCRVRRGNVLDLNVPHSAADVAIVHHVLHYLDDPHVAVAQAARTVRPQGRLLIVDYAPHDHETLRKEHAHRRLGFDDDEVSAWCTGAGMEDVRIEHLRSTTSHADHALTVTIWCATQRAGAVSQHLLEVA